MVYENNVGVKDEIVRKAKSRAALQGLSFSRYTEMCLEISFKEAASSSVKDWIYDLPKVSPQAIREVNQILNDADFDLSAANALTL